MKKDPGQEDRGAAVDGGRGATPSALDAMGPVEKMSERWRRLQREGEIDPSRVGTEPARGFLDRHYLAIGIGIALLLVALMIVIGGVLFLVSNGGAS
jgi:hypothetical protein